MISNEINMQLNPDIPSGVFTEEMSVKYADLKMIDILSDRDSLYRIIPQQDIKLIGDIVSALKVDEQEMIPVRIIDENHNIRAVYMSIQRSDKLKGIFVELYDIKELYDNKHEIMNQYRNIRAMMEITNQVLFQYNHNIDEFSLYTINDEQNIVYCKGKLEGCISYFMDKNSIYKSTLDDFNSFIELVQNGAEIIDARFKTNMLMHKLSMENVHAKGMTYTDPNGIKWSVGVWDIYTDESDNKKNYIIDKYLKDPLTGLINKKEMTEIAQDHIKSRLAKTFALLIIDIDDFKNINDTYGHMIGDEVLKAFAQVLLSQFNEKGIAGRIGGDEFMVIVENYDGIDELKDFLYGVHYNANFILTERIPEMAVTCTIGISQMYKDADNYNDLFMTADKALYRGKIKGKNCFIIYDKDKHGAIPCGYDNRSAIMTDEVEKPSITARELASISQKVVLNGMTSVDELFVAMADYFSLERIDINYGSDLRCVYQYNPKQYPDIDVSILKDNECKMKFNENGLIYSNNVAEYEYAAPQVFKMYDDAKIFSVLQYVIDNENGDILGVITYSRCNLKSVKFAKHTPLLLMISSILETKLRY